MAAEFFFFVDGHEIGPISYAEVLACIRRREITGSTLVRYGNRKPTPAQYLLRKELAGQTPGTGSKAIVAVVAAAALVAVVGRWWTIALGDPQHGVVAQSERSADAIREGAGEGRQQPESKIDYARLAELEKGVVYISVDDRTAGSGFLVDDGKTIATNAHVIEGAVNVTVQFYDDSSCISDGWHAFDRGVDLAIIRVTRVPDGAHTFVLADALPTKGEDVHADGAPLGLKWTLTKGVVSGIRTGAEVNSFRKHIAFNAGSSWIQHTAAIDHGSSGGPLINSFGRVIGINALSCPGEVGPRVFFASSSENLRDLIGTMSPSPRNFAELQSSPIRS